MFLTEIQKKKRNIEFNQFLTLTYNEFQQNECVKYETRHTRRLIRYAYEMT